MFGKLSKLVLGTAAGILFNAIAANASTLDLSANFTFSGTSPAGTAPWITADFSDTTPTGTVQLTLSASDLTGSEFVTGWYLNLDPNLDPTKLVFSAPINLTSGVTAPSISMGENSFKADGDGQYDVELSFETSNHGRFESGDSVTYDITYNGTPTDPFTAQSFDYLSNPDGGEGPFLMAAHVQGIGSDGSASGWVTQGDPIPEPSAAGLVATVAVVGLALRRRRA